MSHGARGGSGKKNGDLLSLAQKAGFQVFLTIDRGIEYEQNLTQLGIAVILDCARSSRVTDLLPHAPEILRVLRSIERGRLVRVG